MIARLPGRADISALRRRYETELLESVVPFWTRHSPDRANGGFWNCLDRDGSLYDTTKYGWLQGRQVWMLAKLHRTVDPRPEWLELALSGGRFLRERFIDEVTGGDPRRYSAEVDECIRLVRLHVKRDTRRVHELVAPDGSPLDSPDGRLLNPGHAIEAGWFLQHWAQRLGREELSREVTHRFKGGPYKGCFHVPRALWLCWRLLQKLEMSSRGTSVGPVPRDPPGSTSADPSSHEPNGAPQDDRSGGEARRS